MTALERLTPMSPSGCRIIIGATSTFERIYNLKPRLTFLPQASNSEKKQKQPDTGVQLLKSNFPSVVFEVGGLGSLGQLRTDARLLAQGYARG